MGLQSGPRCSPKQVRRMSYVNVILVGLPVAVKGGGVSKS